MKCPKCEFENERNSKYCAECGEPLSKDVKPRKEAKEETKEQEVKKKKETTSDDVYEKLREYKALLDDGTLTKEEYDVIKKDLLG